MMRSVVKSKIYRAVATGAVLNYEGSLTIDPNMMRAARMVPFEKILVANVENGARFETYAIEGEPGSGDMILNGAAAHLGKKGDLLIVFSFSLLTDEELKKHQPIVVLPDNENENREFTVRKNSIDFADWLSEQS
jgi:aspartate 1-decarboxylase